jgi:glutamyl-Q tRNA(Asp) synthetase
VLNAIHVWGVARALGGRVLLRLEDHDRGRCRPEYERAILEDLDWLGLEPDVGRLDELLAGPSPFRQSNRSEIYINALHHLTATSQVYGCDCSRKEIAEAAEDGLEERRYSGRCRTRELELKAARGIRVVLEEGAERFTDLLLGDQSQEPAGQCGDPLLRDRLDNWTYQFAVTVDDMEQGIDLVIRGEDLLPSTGRQIRLGRMLGRSQAPAYLHHALLYRPDGFKLSKAKLDSGIRELRAAGMSPSAVLGRAAFLGGLFERPDELPVGELHLLFLNHLSKLDLRYRPQPSQ